jgi:hypothetical protein
MGVFQDKIITRFAPSWFQEQWMRVLLRAVGGELDNFQQRVFDGLRAGNPYAAGAKTSDGVLLECDEEVLEYHARDRGIRLYSSEPLLSKRKRLGAWRQLKKRRGSHQGELRNLQPFWAAEETSTLPTMRIVHQSNEATPTATWHTLAPDGSYSVIRRTPSNWNWDADPTKRSRFWLIIYLPAGYSSTVYYDTVGLEYDSGAIYDGVTTLAISDIVQAILEAKAAHSRLAGVIVTALAPTDDADVTGQVVYPFDPESPALTLPDGSTSHPTGNWGTHLDPVTNLPTRPPYATFIYEDPA